MINKYKHYLGTGLKVQFEDGELLTLEGLCRDSENEGIGLFGEVMMHCSLSKITPYLRPLSKLTEPITVKGYNDGKEFVPMEHLYELSIGDGSIGSIKTTVITDIIKNDIARCFDLNKDHSLTFGFSDMNFRCFYDRRHTEVKNQIELFNLLHRWHFNLYFDEGEFIEI